MAWEERGNQRYYYRSRRVNGRVVKEQVDDTPALTGERRQTADADADFARDLSQPGKLSRPVFENYSQIRGHRIFDPAM